MRYFISLLFALLALAGSSQNINTDSSKVEFSVTKLGKHVVEGTITGMTGSIEFYGDFLIHIDVCIDPKTINTENKRRDAHLRNEDYFDVKNYPSICFASDSIISIGDSISAIGKLTMLDSTRNETVALYYSKSLIKGYLVVDRFLYDLGGEGDYKIGRKVKIEIFAVLTDED